MRNKLIVTFVGSSAIFALPDVYYIIRHIGLKREAFYGIIISTISGMLFAAVLTAFIYIFIRLANKKYGASNSDLTQHGEIYLDGDLKKLFPNSLSLFEKSGKFKTIKPFIAINKIEMQTGMSWQCLGEHIEVIFSSNNERVKVDVTSKPRYKTTLVDYGKNAENVEFILSLLGQTS